MPDLSLSVHSIDTSYVFGALFNSQWRQERNKGKKKKINKVTDGREIFHLAESDSGCL